MQHLMIDLETLGTKSNSAIISIAAVQFDMLTGNTGKVFERSISLQSGIQLGLEVDPNTALWWISQENALESWAMSKKIEIGTALADFIHFFKTHCAPDTEVWGNSNRFDLGLLENAYTKLEIDIPWNFRYERDVRTLTSFAPDIKEKAVKEFKAKGALLHNPRVDCLMQIHYCSAIYRNLMGLDNEA